jgi:hypothetical protein
MSVFSLLLFFQISYFYLFIFIIFFTKIYKIIDDKKSFFLINTIIFYLLRIVFSLSNNFDRFWNQLSLYNFSYSNTRFYDLQQNLVSMKCIRGNVDGYYYKFSSTSYVSCPFSAKYGPLSTKIPFFGDIWTTTIILSICAIITYLYIYKRVLDSSENYFFVTALFLSPSSNFLIERMNIDIFIYLVGFLCLINYKKYPKINTFILLVMALYKLHPLGFLLGLTLYFAIKMEKKYFQINLIAVFSFFVLYFFDVIVNKNFLATELRPAGLRTTFGLLADSLILNKYFNSDVPLFYTALCVLIVLISMYFRRVHYELFFDLNDKYSLIFYSFSFLILINFLYANYDYRVALFTPVSFLVYIKNKTNMNLLHYFIFLMPIGLEATSLDDRFILIDNTLSVLGRLSIYMLVGFLVANIIKNIQDISLRNIYKFVTKSI